MSFPIRCTECNAPMLAVDDETDTCVNGACEMASYPIPHEPDDPQESPWTDSLEAA